MEKRECFRSIIFKLFNGVSMKFRDVLNKAKEDTKEDDKPKATVSKKDVEAQQKIDDQLAKSRVLKTQKK